jgi:acyl-coenzyme A synthetase/AMP-(fatty) acid ligase
VDPGQVARRLLGHPAVAEACVRLHDTPHGPRLKAFIVPHADTGAMKAQSDEGAHTGDAAVQALQQEIEAWCRRQFSPAARPMHIRIGRQLPRNEMGKRCDWPL